MSWRFPGNSVSRTDASSIYPSKPNFQHLSPASSGLYAYNWLLLQDRPLQVSLLPEFCCNRQRHLEREITKFSTNDS